MKKIFVNLILATIISCSESKLPEGIEYNIIQESEQKSSNKIMIDVRINKRVSLEELTVIAKEIKTEKSGYEIYMINYYVPDQSLKSRAYAISHFTPEPTIEILGATQVEIKKMANTKKYESEIGRWHEDDILYNRAVVIYSNGKKYFIHSTYKDGSEGTEPLTLKIKAKDTLYFEKLEEPNIYYKVVNESLLHYSNNKLFTTSKPN